MTRSGIALWVLAVLAYWVAPQIYMYRNPPALIKCPPECARCSGPWALNSKSVCTPKNMKGMR